MVIAVPDFQSVMLPFLEVLGDGQVLIDGTKLAALMIEHNVGVTPTRVFELKEVSNDFFDEDEGKIMAASYVVQRAVACVLSGRTLRRVLRHLRGRHPTDYLTSLRILPGSA